MSVLTAQNPELKKLSAVQEVVAKINAMTIVSTESEDYYPILHTSLSVHNGISISGKFKTTSINQNALSYVTVLRQGTSKAPADGLGFAWTIGDGTKYNVYLVDSNPLNNDIMFNESFLLQNAGENTFLAAGKGEINSNEQYSFRLDVNLDYSTVLYIWPTSKGGLNVNDVDTIALTHSGFIPRSDGDHFGIGVLGTKGAEWYYDDLMIQSIASLHTAALFKLKANTSNFPNGTDVTIKYYGYGYDGTTYALNAYIYKPLTSTWELVGTNTATNATPTSLTEISIPFTISTAYRDVSDFVQLMVTTPTTGADVSEVTTYYVKLENTAAAGIHVGGKADVYYSDPDNVAIGEQVVDNINGYVSLSTANGFAVPVLNVARVVVETTNEELAEFTDWELYSDSAGLAYSTREVPYISVAPAYNATQLRVTYRFNQKGVAIQSLLDSAEHRYVGTDTLAKTTPPVIVRINTLNFKGTLTVERAQELLKDYIINATVITISDIVALLMANGATYIDTTSIDIDVVEYDHTRTVVSVSTITTSYSVPTFRMAYADSYSMSGVIKI